MYCDLLGSRLFSGCRAPDLLFKLLWSPIIETDLLPDSGFIAGLCGVCNNLGIESCKTEADLTGDEIREKFLQFFEGNGSGR